MSNSFYSKLAFSNINKNKKIYYPYILTCIFTVMMFYMISAITNNTNLSKVHSAENLKILLDITLNIARIFAVIFLFYTNSFLMKRRKKEIGLYNILGMEKRHIGKMMLCETGIITIISIGFGMVLGILFSKLLFLFLLKLISFDVVLGFDVPAKAVVATVILFGAIFALTLLYNLAKIHLAKPIELLHGGEIGEKEPKTKIFITLIGAGCLGWGYWFALTVESPLSAMTFFFVAVLMVILGTYALFTSGSIALLKLLRKNKKFYYQTKHFTNVSGMLYRMKQNAIGLANICILSTMVLIMVSTTVSLYAGMEDTLKKQFPTTVSVNAKMKDTDSTAEVDAAVAKEIKKSGITSENYVAYHSTQIACKLDGNKFNLITEDISAYSSSDIKMCIVVSLDEFNKINNTDYALNKNEVLLYSKKNLDKFDELNIGASGENKNYKVKTKLNNIADCQISSYENIVDCYTIVVNNLDTLQDINSISGASGRFAGVEYWIGFDVKGGNDMKDACMNLSNSIEKNVSIEGTLVEAGNSYEGRESLYGMYGGFLFIGLFLGILFIMATVLIIYYKQISEGYEDKERFEIMQKVGMTHAEVKKSIRSQVVMVFFLPLAIATLHVAVSFRIIQKMLLLLGLANTWLFIACTVGALLIFCIIYGIVFAITTRSYYKIVSTAKEN